ncbi:DUF4105 domain-containing protein [Maribacter sp. 2307ULW6-5]|uniref:lipoprotein N-acyltransferase Lnb domain-containing protein n=1 Tax=Maribacter sp. 2307ULW6-5 TaxID=3386275 RepID=UPI0039BCACD0
MKQTIILTLLFMCLFVRGFSQGGELSPLSKLSLLTVGTGTDLAAKFGHSGIRLQDPALGVDVVYGYGTYNFEDPNFYLNFVRGKLDYTISRYPFDLFKKSYVIEQRWVREQPLNLDLEQRKAVVSFLETNLLPQNRLYKYDFLFENCATKIPEVFEKNLGNALEFNFSHLGEQRTFRQLIHQNLNVNSWSNFGIDLALGSVIDREATPYEHMFLPIYVYQQLKHTTVNGQPLAGEETVVLDLPTPQDHTPFLLSPAFWLGLLSLLTLWVTYRDGQRASRSRALDVFLFAFTGLAGAIIVFLWFFTDHDATKGNLNLLWALATHLIVAFYVAREPLPKWLFPYLALALLLLAITVILWLLAVQVFSPLIIFVLLALAVRYGYLIWYLRRPPLPQSA